ncbi:amidohydrolase [Thermoleophilia bacterium SCSIO 60948]|nr:amidohydrolase [Thermoleophilia bacterium SCSIO 60948]
MGPDRRSLDGFPQRRRDAAGFALACIAALGASIAGTGVGASTAAPGSAPDVILRNGEILTMDGKRPRAQAIAITDERISAVGRDGAVTRTAGLRTRVVNLRGRTVVPGLIDGHTHAIRGGQTYADETYWLDETSLASALDKIADEAAAKAPEEWTAVIGGWHPNQFSEGEAPTVADLTEAAPDRPVYVQYLYDYALVNDAGIEALGLNESETPPAPGIVVERDENGDATGRLTGGIGPFNTLVATLLPATPEERKDSLESYFGELTERGVTGFIDDSAGPSSAYDALYALADEGRLDLRAGYRIPAQAPGNESAFFEQVMAFRPPRQPDGEIPFVGIGESIVFGVNDGVRYSPGFQSTPEARQELREVATYAAQKRIPLEIHAYNDDTASQILDVFEEVDQTYPIGGLRWAMAHLNTGSPETIARMQALGMAFSVQMGPYFEAPQIKDGWGEEIARRAAVREAIDQGVRVAGGTDATRVGDFRVWPAVEFQVTGASAGNAVVRPPDQRLSRMEALRAYTQGSAWLAFDNDDRGTLRPGKFADIAVLDKPYMDVPKNEIGDLRSVLTMRGGEPVYDKRGLLD